MSAAPCMTCIALAYPEVQCVVPSSASCTDGNSSRCDSCQGTVVAYFSMSCTICIHNNNNKDTIHALASMPSAPRLMEADKHHQQHQQHQYLHSCHSSRAYSAGQPTAAAAVPDPNLPDKSVQKLGSQGPQHPLADRAFNCWWYNKTMAQLDCTM